MIFRVTRTYDPPLTDSHTILYAVGEFDPKEGLPRQYEVKHTDFHAPDNNSWFLRQRIFAGYTAAKYLTINGKTFSEWDAAGRPIIYDPAVPNEQRATEPVIETFPLPGKQHLMSEFNRETKTLHIRLFSDLPGTVSFFSEYRNSVNGDTARNIIKEQVAYWRTKLATPTDSSKTTSQTTTGDKTWFNPLYR